MNIVCEKTLLSNAIDGVSRAVTLRSSISALEGIHMVADGFSLTLTCYNLELAITITIEANVRTPGECVLNAKLLGDMVRRMPSGEVELAPYLSKYLLAAAGRDGDVERLRVLLADDAAGNISLSETAREQLRAAVERADMPAAATAEEPGPGSSGTSRPSGASASSAEGGR